MRRTPLIPVAVAAVSLLATAFAPAANAAEPEELATGLVSPLSLAVAEDGTVYVAQNFAGLLTKVGAEAPIYADPNGSEVGAVEVAGDVVTFATTGGTPKKPSAKVWTIEGAGAPTQLADLWAFEKSRNPDGKVKYGIQRLSKSCIKKIPKRKRQGIVAYRGIKESHPYATAIGGDTTYVADAAANAIFGISDGALDTVAVIPPVRVEVTKKLRKSFGLPKCVQGKTFKSESVPTDVELGPDGNLYVTTLGGGLGEQMPLGAVYRVDPATGKVARMAGGLMSPVGIAIEPDGTSYISLLFPGLVMTQELGGAPEVFAEVPFPGDVEVSDGSVYVTQTDLTNDGSSPPAGKVLKFDVPIG